VNAAGLPAGALAKDGLYNVSVASPVHLIVFDLDGTIMDSQRDMADSANEMLAGYGAGPLDLDAVTAMVGNGAGKLVERALAAAGVSAPLPEALGRFLAIYDRRLIEHTAPYEGLPAIITRAATRAPLAVLTNKTEDASRRLLEAFGLLAPFRWVIGSDSSFPRKPDPTSLRHLIALAGASPETTLMVGDSAVDMETASRARTAMCVALYGYGRTGGPLPLTGGERIAETPADIRRHIDEFLMPT
jgi:phosphoglycolate phosphatase